MESLQRLIKELGFYHVTFVPCHDLFFFKYNCPYYCVCAFFFFTFRIKHENIVALEDIYESPNHLYLVMQL